MNDEKENANGDQEDKKPQSPSEETDPSGGDQSNQPVPPTPEDSSHPGDKKRKVSGARILRNLVAESLHVPGWPRLEQKLNELEDVLEELHDEGEKPKD